MSQLKALEFFSGIGAFRILAPEFGIAVKSAFDQSEEANIVYKHNFRQEPCSRNLDTISGAELDDADLWFLSPPCKPFSRRGKKADLDDPRAAALINLLYLLPHKQPRFLLLENVLGFAGSRAEKLLLESSAKIGYKCNLLQLCPTQFGIPMQRPRLFYCISKGFKNKVSSVSIPSSERMAPLASFIKASNAQENCLLLDQAVQERYFQSLNIINPEDREAKAICFTSGYGTSLRASGSFISLPEGQLRHFSPEEIILLLGFPSTFEFPADMPLSSRWRLAGNSVDLRSLRLALSTLLQ